MKHHYWEAPIVIYLFLGGLGGGIFFLSALFDLIDCSRAPACCSSLRCSSPWRRWP